MYTQICLISKYLEPNIYSLLQFKSDRLVLVHTKETRENAELLANFAEDQLGINVYIDDFIETDAFAINTIQTDATRLILELKKSSNQVLLNYTAGTKPMCIAFYQVANQFQIEALYTDSQHKVFYYTQNQSIKKIPFSFQHKPLDNLILRDAKVVSMRKVKSDDILFGLANYLFQHRENKAKKVYQDLIKLAVYCNKKELPYQPNYEDSQLVVSTSNVSDDNWQIHVEFDGIELNQKQQKFWLSYFSGGWFEYWTAAVLLRTGKYSDLLMNVKIAPNNPDFQFRPDSLKNELDIIAVQDFMPFVFECKAGAVKQQHITNLQSTSSYFFPKYQQPVLVSYFTIENELMDKCADYGIKVIHGRSRLQKELMQLDRKDDSKL